MKATWEEKQRASDCGEFENSKTRRARRNRLITRAQAVIGGVYGNDERVVGFKDLVAELEQGGHIRRLTRGRIRVTCHGAARICQVLDVVHRIKEEP